MAVNIDAITGIISFPGTFTLHGAHLPNLCGNVRVVYLAGREDQCIDAFLARERETGRGLNALHWAQNNQAIFEFLKTDDARPYIVTAFDENGRRGVIVDQVLADLAALPA